MEHQIACCGMHKIMRERMRSVFVVYINSVIFYSHTAQIWAHTHIGIWLKLFHLQMKQKPIKIITPDINCGNACNAIVILFISIDCIHINTGFSLVICRLSLVRLIQFSVESLQQKVSNKKLNCNAKFADFVSWYSLK